MKINSLATARSLQNSKFWLLGIAVSLVALHISLTWKLTNNADQLSISVLIWGAILSLLWTKRNILDLESGLTSSFFGILLIVLVLVKSLSFSWLGVLPLVSAVGLGLLASGFTGLRQFWREFVIVSFLLVPEKLLSVAAEEVVRLSLLTAQSVTFVLHYVGFEVYRQGVNIVLPTGAVEVDPGCSGFQSIFLLIQLAVLYLLVFPTNLSKTILVPIAAVGIAFIVNAIRVVLMTLLVAFSHPEAFEYWHKGSGSQLFSLVAVVAFGLLCSFLSRHDESEHQSSVEQSES